MSLTSIVVPNWNTKEITLRCVEQIRRHTTAPFELLLVDNGSHDGSPKALKGLEDSRTRVLLLPENLGFAGGSNRGIAESRGDAICLLNSDTRVSRRWLERLRARLLAGAGLVGPSTDHAKGPQRRRPFLGRFPRPRWRVREVDDLSFFCVLLSRSVIDRVGLLDERFGLGTFEDDDYCRRAKAAGFRLEIAPFAWVWHDAHATFLANALDAGAVQEQNRPVFEAKHKP